MPTPRPADPSVDFTGEFPLGPAEYLFYLLFQAARQRDLFFGRTAGASGLTLQHWRTLAVIRRIQNCSMKDLALYAAVDRTTLTRVVDHLVAQGLVERWSPARDRRQVQVALSAAGETAFDGAVASLLESNRAMLAGVDEASAREAARVLQQIIRNMMEDPLAAERLLAYGRPPQSRADAESRRNDR
ncbi:MULTISPECIES: MarR family winged helix-turn-helix transcriptional regulator [unclassified Phenylobacterium]|jgi:MarR family transcriptional regulator, lower aerobic nicotinate degradation pathway regulator|uniref:MarR family winged helix-turn-helix transcriptional regulator n=1 Tax=unclassified Phenylobacterium TaxID=2640670 RepID=UPI00083B5C0F|nr:MULTISPECIES: MarR family transcriptional regulator [unclassified Phenylobacterium]